MDGAGQGKGAIIGWRWLAGIAPPKIAGAAIGPWMGHFVRAGAGGEHKLPPRQMSKFDMLPRPIYNMAGYYCGSSPSRR